MSCRLQAVLKVAVQVLQIISHTPLEERDYLSSCSYFFIFRVFILKNISNLDLVWFRKQNSLFFNKNLISIDSVTNLSRYDNSDQIWHI